MGEDMSMPPLNSNSDSYDDEEINVHTISDMNNINMIINSGMNNNSDMNNNSPDNEVNTQIQRSTPETPFVFEIPNSLLNVSYSTTNTDYVSNTTMNNTNELFNNLQNEIQNPE